MKTPQQVLANKKQEHQFPAAQSAGKNQNDNSVPSQILAQTPVNQSPYAQEMMSYQQMANNSPRVKEAATLQAMADRSPQVQAAIQMQAAADAYVRANDPFSVQTLSNNQASLQGQTPEKTENRTGLPDKLKAGVESLSGISIDDVRVHYNSSKPAQLNALAYAQGTDIHVAPGQERHLPHEAWHVIQQKQGRVKTTTQMKGVGVNDDVGLEREADVMGKRALKKVISVPVPSKTHSKTTSSIKQMAGWFFKGLTTIYATVVAKNAYKLSQVETGKNKPMSSTRLGAYDATKSMPSGSTGQGAHRAIGLLYLGFGSVGEAKIGDYFWDAGTQTLLRQLKDQSSLEVAKGEHN